MPYHLAMPFIVGDSQAVERSFSHNIAHVRVVLGLAYRPPHGLMSQAAASQKDKSNSLQTLSVECCVKMWAKIYPTTLGISLGKPGWFAASGPLVQAARDEIPLGAIQRKGSRDFLSHDYPSRQAAARPKHIRLAGYWLPRGGKVVSCKTAWEKVVC